MDFGSTNVMPVINLSSKMMAIEIAFWILFRKLTFLIPWASSKLVSEKAVLTLLALEVLRCIIFTIQFKRQLKDGFLTFFLKVKKDWYRNKKNLKFRERLCFYKHIQGCHARRICGRKWHSQNMWKKEKKERFNIYKIISDQRFQCKGVAHFSCKSPSAKHEKWIRRGVGAKQEKSMQFTFIYMFLRETFI